MAVTEPSSKALREAAKYNQTGLRCYVEWDIDGAIDSFGKAAASDPANPEYHLNLARAYARGGSYPDAMRSLGDYLHTETDERLANRYERLFSSAMDEVEIGLIGGMQSLDLPVELIGRALHMWLEYRLTIGRQPLQVRRPEPWSAALCYAVCKINSAAVEREQVASVFETNPRSLKEKFDLLLETLDLIPADYRYFVGQENPLDKLVETAEALEAFYRDFKES